MDEFRKERKKRKIEINNINKKTISDILGSRKRHSTSTESNQPHSFQIYARS